MFIRKSKLSAEVDRWQSAGWVDAAGAAAIRTDLARQRPGFGATGLFAIAGAILLVLAGLSFVAANWDAMSKLARLALIGGSLAACYAAASALFRRGLDLFGDAAVLVGIGLYGAGIALVAQMYHLSGDAADAVLLWALGALAAGALLLSRPAIAAAIVLGFAWSMVSVGSASGAHWLYLPVWAATAFPALTARWPTGLNLAALALSAWFAVTCLDAFPVGGRTVLVVAGLTLSLVAVAGYHRFVSIAPVAETLLAHGVTLGFLGLLVIQFGNILGGPVSQATLAVQWFRGGMTLALLAAAMAGAARIGSRRDLWVAFAFFGVEVFALYVNQIGSRLGTSAFFLTTGALVMAFAAAAYKLRHIGAGRSA